MLLLSQISFPPPMLLGASHLQVGGDPMIARQERGLICTYLHTYTGHRLRCRSRVEGRDPRGDPVGRGGARREGHSRQQPSRLARSSRAFSPRARGWKGSKADRLTDIVKGLFATVQPIPRAGLPEDIARAAVFLASDRSSFISGQDLVVAGSRSRRRNCARLVRHVRERRTLGRTKGGGGGL